MTTAVKKFEIHLEHDIDEQYQYTPGEVLRGSVLMSNTDEIRIAGVMVLVQGEATVAWDDEATRGQCSTSETYVEATINVLQNEGGDKVVSVGRGDHKYNFEYILPPNLPSSFIGKYGSITYVLKASLKEDKRLGLGQLVTSEPFLVLRRLEIDKNPELQKKHTVTATKRVSGAACFCIFGKIEAEFTVNKTGHLPGDDMLIDGQMRNDSPRSILSIQASLVLNSTFHAKNKVRRHSQMVAKKVDSSEIEFNDVRQWSAVRLAVPPYIPESRLDGCDMIDIAYELQFRIEIEGGSELRCFIPITIGTPIDERRASERNAWKPENYTINSTDNTVPMAGSNHEGPMGNLDIDDVNLEEEEMNKFRHPMQFGETRTNILFTDDAF